MLRKELFIFVIPIEGRNLSFFSNAQIEKRFLASLGMTKCLDFVQSVVWKLAQHPSRFQ